MKINFLITGIILTIGIFISGCSLTKDECNNRCEDQGFTKGMCLSGGSGVGNQNPCEKAGAIAINIRENPVPGCDYEAIGAWDSCCCFN